MHAVVTICLTLVTVKNVAIILLHNENLPFLKVYAWKALQEWEAEEFQLHQPLQLMMALGIARIVGIIIGNM